MKTSGLVLFVCSGLLLSGGAILGGSTAWGLLRMSYYFWTTELGVELGATVVVMAGALLCLPACWLATVVPYHGKSTALSFALISLATASMLMLSVGISSASNLARALREPHALNSTMTRALTYASFDPTVRSAFYAMQIELRCCGVNSPSDWLLYRNTLPPACCGRVWNGKRNDYCSNPTFTIGCRRPALCELKNYANSLTVLAAALIIVMAVTLFASSYSVVTQVVERAEARPKPLPPAPVPLCVACLPHLQPPSQLLQPRLPPFPTSITQV